ncbi:MAG: 4Fe-4S dicluster domain-containing protein [Myxococcales bacterium]|nr:4Fe-4S dicluster domain-containing protein [Myxococcales bacterium]
MSDVYELTGLRQLADHLAREARVVAPQHDGEHRCFALLSEDGDLEICREPSQLPLAAKPFLFAERESLFVFDGARFVETPAPSEPLVLFGLTACDLTAIAYLDRFFEGDPHYVARRRAALLVGVDCERGCRDGFCDAMDAGPGVRDGSADLVVHTAPDASPLLFIGSERGAAAVAGLALEPAPADATERRARGLEAAEASLGARPHIAAGIARLDAGEVSAELWEELGLRCLACSGCTTVCPTCTCFTTTDEPEGDGARRLRYWDSCLFEGFQREASGHHPAPTAGMRLERFFRHKLGEPVRARFGRATCVGCGRCESACPAVLGIHSTLGRIAAT